MTALQRIGLVAEREFVEYARQPSFRNGTIVTAIMIGLAVAAYSILPAILGGPDEVRLGVLPDAVAVVDALEVLADPEATIVEIVEVESRGEADDLLRADEVDAVLVDGTTVVVREELDSGLGALLDQALSTTALSELLGSTPREALSATHVAMEVEALEPLDPAVNQRRVITLIAVMMALGQVMTGAYVIASGTVEEKTSRVMEVVVAKVHPRTLLTGKLVGLGLVLLVQLLLLVAVGLVGLALSPDLSIPEGLFASSGAILLWYLLGFTIFGALFSIAAALSSRQEDMAQKMAPMMYLLFAAFAAGFYAFGNPDTILTRIVTFVPITAPAVLPARQAAGAIAGWEVALAVMVTLAGAVLAVRFAGRVYTAGALRTRGSQSFRSALGSSAE